MIEFFIFITYLFIGFSVACAVVRRNKMYEADIFVCVWVLWPLVIVLSFVHYVIEDIKSGAS